MSFIINYNTPLQANEEYVSDSIFINEKYVSISVSFNTNVNGVLEIFHSLNGVSFENFGDIYQNLGNSNSQETVLKGKYVKVRFINLGQPQTFFNLIAKLNVVMSNDIQVSTNYEQDSVTVYAGATGLNIRALSNTTDSVDIPQLTPVIISDSGVTCINARINSMPPIVIPPITISSVSITDSNGGDILADAGTLRVSTISGFATHSDLVSTNSKLDSLITGTRILSSNGSSITVDASNNLNVNVKNTSLNVEANITNDILAVESVINSDAPYDLIINGATLWADTTPVSNPFFADLNGREGWYYDNLSNIANKSNIYWYANPTTGIYQENDMTFAQLSNMYCIITPDYVDNGELTIPFMGVYSQPQGNSSDFISGFAHSRWVYQLSNTNLSKLRKGETILLYTGPTRPDVHLNIPSYQLSLVTQNGDALSSEIIAYMTVNTQGTTSKIGYLLQYTGFFNSAIGFNREFQFRNSKDRIIQNNQYLNLVGITGNVTVDTGLTSIFINNESLDVNTGLTSIFINNESLNVDTGLTSIFINNESLDVNTGLTSIFINNESLNVDTGLTSLFINNPSLNVDTGLTSLFISNPSLNVDTGLTSLFISNPSLNVDTGLTSLFISNPSLNVDTGLTSLFISNPSLNVDTGLTSLFISNPSLNVDTGLTSLFISNPSLNVDTGLTSLFISNPSLNVDTGLTSLFISNPSLNVDTGLTSLFISNPSLNVDTGLTSLFISNPSLYVNVRDGVGTPITSTIDIQNSKVALDVSLIQGGSVSISGTPSVNAKLQFNDGTYQSYTSNSLKKGADVHVINASAISVQDEKIALAFDATSNSIKTLTTFPSSINSNVTNSSLDVHCYASSNGTSWHHLKSDSNGVLNTHSMIQDGSGNDITSTLNGAKRGLDVNVSNSSVPISGSVSISGVPYVSSTITDVSGNSVTTSSILSQLNKRYLDTTSNVKGLNIIGGSSTNENLTCSAPATQKSVNTADSFTRALDCNSFLSGYNNATGDIKMLTMSESSGKRALDVNIGITALDVTVVPPEEITINMGGYTNATTTTILGYQSNLNVTTSNYFRGSTKYLWLYSTATQRILTIRYTDLNGDLQTATQTVIPNTWTGFTNNANFSGLIDIQSNLDANSGTIIWSIRQVNIAPPNNNDASGAITNFFYFNGLITIPNLYRARIKSYYIFTNNVATQVYWYVFKPTAGGFRGSYSVQNMTSATNFTDLNYYFEAGDTICLIKANSSTDTYYQCKLILEKI